MAPDEPLAAIMGGDDLTPLPPLPQERGASGFPLSSRERGLRGEVGQTRRQNHTATAD
jgi:hypothetical protein